MDVREDVRNQPTYAALQLIAGAGCLYFAARVTVDENQVTPLGVLLGVLGGFNALQGATKLQTGEGMITYSPVWRG